jgi:radical SAM protein with 4Fe4S-binding SPASM domain
MSFISVLQPDYFENRNDNYLLIWKNLPQWMIIDKEAFQFIELADGTRTLDEILKILYYNETQILEKKKDLKFFLGNLIEKGLMNVTKKNSIHNTSQSKPVLENISINLTRKCNLRCKHCFIIDYKSDDSLEIEALKNFVYEAKEKRFLSKNLNFAILGGEPLLEEQKVIDIAEFGRELGYKVIVSTNGLLLNSNFCRKANENNLEVQVSLEGASEKINDPIRGRGTFEKVKNGLKLLIDNNVHTIISMVVHKENFKDLEKFYYFGREMGVNEVRYIPLKMMGQAKKNISPTKRTHLLYAIRNLINKNSSEKKYFGRDFYTIMTRTCANCSKTTYCGTGSKTILIDSDGECYPCPNHNWTEFKCGNIHTNSFEEIWLDSPVLQNLRNIYNVNTMNDDCSNCIVKYWCAGGCRGEAYENTKILTSKATACDDIRQCILETFWILSGKNYSKSPKQREYF